MTLTDQLEVVPILRHNVEQNPTLGGGSMEAGSKLVAKHGVKLGHPVEGTKRQGPRKRGHMFESPGARAALGPRCTPRLCARPKGVWRLRFPRWFGLVVSR